MSHRVDCLAGARHFGYPFVLEALRSCRIGPVAKQLCLRSDIPLKPAIFHRPALRTDPMGPHVFVFAFSHVSLRIFKDLQLLSKGNPAHVPINALVHSAQPILRWT